MSLDQGVQGEAGMAGMAGHLPGVGRGKHGQSRPCPASLSAPSLHSSGSV